MLLLLHHPHSYPRNPTMGCSSTQSREGGPEIAQPGAWCGRQDGSPSGTLALGVLFPPPGLGITELEAFSLSTSAVLLKYCLYLYFETGVNVSLNC